MEVLVSLLFLIHAIPTGARSFSNALFGRGVGAIVMNSVNCDAHEERLIDCPQSITATACSHSEDAAVRCQTNEGESLIKACMAVLTQWNLCSCMY